MSQLVRRIKERRAPVSFYLNPCQCRDFSKYIAQKYPGVPKVEIKMVGVKLRAVTGTTNDQMKKYTAFMICAEKDKLEDGSPGSNNYIWSRYLSKRGSSVSLKNDSDHVVYEDGICNIKSLKLYSDCGSYLEENIVEPQPQQDVNNIDCGYYLIMTAEVTIYEDVPVESPNAKTEVSGETSGSVSEEVKNDAPADSEEVKNEE